MFGQTRKMVYQFLQTDFTKKKKDKDSVKVPSPITKSTTSVTKVPPFYKGTTHRKTKRHRGAFLSNRIRPT